jgi:hypothetical protein
MAMPCRGNRSRNLSADNQWLISTALNTFILAHRAGLKSDFPREYDDWTKRPMLFLPSPLTSTTSVIVHVHSDFYEKVRKYVEGGGFVYASVAADAGIPDMETIFGARLVDTVTASEVTLKIVEPFGGLKSGDTFHYAVPGANQRFWGSLLEVKGGKVIAVDQDGRPALIANSVGSGKTLLSAYPIESYLANTPSAFEKPETTYRIYEAFRNWTGVKPAFRSDQPSVEVTSLRGDHHGYAVVVNHSAQAYKATISTSLPVKSVGQVGSDNSKPLHLDGSTWKMDLEPYQASIVEWK